MDINDFKLTVEILSSIASIIAILIVIIAWVKSTQDILKISEVIVGGYDDNIFEFSVRIKNRKNYPVTIQSISCFKKKRLRLQKISLQKPEYQTVLSLEDRLFINNTELKMSEFGEGLFKERVRINLKRPRSLLFNLYTSHGLLHLRCKNIHFFEKSIVTYVTDYSSYKNGYFSAFLPFSRCWLAYIVGLAPFKFNKWLANHILPKGEE